MKIPPYLTAALAFLWLWSGLQPILTAPDASLQLLADIGIATPWRRPLFYAASAWDVLLGILILTPLRRLRARHDGAKFIFVLEGVAMYFSEPEISTFMRNLAQRFSGVVMLDLLSRFAASIEPKRHDVLRYIANPPKFKLGIDDERSLEAWDERIKLLKTGVMMDIRPEKWCLAAKIFRIFSKIKNSCKMCVYGLNLS